MEIWKDIKGFEGIYQISNYGRLKSFRKYPDGYILSNRNKNGWYLTVNLYIGKKRYTRRIHRLVAEAFLSNPYNKPEINHKDGNKQNNHISNLEWVTPQENMKHAIKMNPKFLDGMIHYNKHVKTYPVIQLSLNDEFIAEFPSAIEASNKTGICSRNISQVALHEEGRNGCVRSQAGGYNWMLKSEWNE